MRISRVLISLLEGLVSIKGASNDCQIGRSGIPPVSVDTGTFFACHKRTCRRTVRLRREVASRDAPLSICGTPGAQRGFHPPGPAQQPVRRGTEKTAPVAA